MTHILVQFQKEWEELFEDQPFDAPSIQINKYSENSKSKIGQSVDDDLNREKKKIIEKVEELENISWFLHDAQNGANIYSDRRLDFDLQQKGQYNYTMKTAHHLNDLFIQNSQETTKHSQKQIDMIRRYTKMNYTNWVIASMVILLILANDHFDFLSDYEYQVVTKIVIVVIILVLLASVFKKNQDRSEELIDLVHQEKKNAKQIKQSLNVFQSRVVSYVKASPSDFAKILLDDSLYNDFKFNMYIYDPKKMSKAELEQRRKKQKEQDEFYRELEQLQNQKLENPERAKSYQESEAQSVYSKAPSLNPNFVNRENLKLIQVFDRENERFIICEKTYELQKIYVLQLSQNDDSIQVVQYISPIINVGTAPIGRGFRGIDIDAKEFMALRNIIHASSPNPFKKYNYNAPPSDSQSSPEKVVNRSKNNVDLSLQSSKRYPYGDQSAYIKNENDVTYRMGSQQIGLLMQIKPKGIADQTMYLDKSAFSNPPDHGNIVDNISQKSGKTSVQQQFVELTGVPEACFEIERVLDWEKRIANYTDKQKGLYKKGLEKMEEFKELLVDKKYDWQVTIQQKKKRIFCEQAYTTRGYPIMRVNAESDYDALTTFRAYCNAENRMKYDKNVESASILDRIGVNFVYGYQSTHRIMTVASRDVYQYCFYNILPDDSIIMVIFEEEDMPEEEGKVRMRLPVGGIHCIPKKDDPTKCDIEMVVECSLEGYIPAWVQKQAISDSAFGLVLLRDLMKGYVKKMAKAIEQNPVIEQQK